MSFPAQAFAAVAPRGLDPGRLFKFRGQWALRVAHEKDFEGFLLLEGDDAGQVHAIFAGMVPALAVIQPFSWFPVIDRGAAPSRDATLTLALGITEVGPVLTWLDARDQVWKDTHMTFGLDGRGIDDQSLYRAGRFEQWSAELFHDSRPFVSLGTLFEVDRRGQQR